MGWLCRAQDSGTDRGVAASYGLSRGWTASYPETTGYIVPTFLDYAARSGRSRYRDRALEIGEWLLSIQLEEGAFQAGTIDQAPRPSVFNTGQILQGLVALFRGTEDDRYLDSLTRAADWLLAVQDVSGSWSEFAYRDTAHSYYSRVAWALLQAHALTGRSAWRKGAMGQLEWARENQLDNGWFRLNSFDLRKDPFTHTIVYAAEGFHGAGLILEDDRYLRCARDVADALRARVDSSGYVPGEFDARWANSHRYACLTGSAQLAGLLLRLYSREMGDETYLDAARRVNAYVMSTQRLESGEPGIRGGVKGSDPIWGRYMTYTYPNWAAKFLADSLMLEADVLEGMASPPLNRS